MRTRALSLLLFAAPIVAQHGDEPYAPEVKAASEEADQAIERTIVHDGYRVELFAAEPHLANPVVFAIDSSMRFYVAETFRLHRGVTDMRSHMNWLDDELACRTVEDRVAMMRKHEGDRFEERYAREHERVKLVWDADGDGVADTSTVFADGFQDPADGIAAGVLPVGDDVYYACIPDLWVLRDEDGDGVSDSRRSLHTGWGVHIALLGHDMHGLQRGPDGRLYWSIGDRGFHVEHEGKVHAHHHAGAVLRSDLDGSNLEVYATGLRNPQELCFDDHGNLWTGDNNSDGGDRARWTYVLEGSEIGWRHAFQYIRYPNARGPWNAEKVWHPPHEGQPAYALPCVANFSDGPSGLAYYPGTGFGPEWRGHFFLCDFRGGPRNSGVHAFRVEPKGAGFELVDPKRFLWNCLPTDVDFGPDGNLYFSDWVNGWGMTGKGRLYRVTTDAHAEERAEVGELLGGGMSRRGTGELAALLRHPNQRVRLEAQWALADRSAAGVLLEAARDREAGLGRLHGLWGLGQVARTEPRRAEGIVRDLLGLHDEAEDEVRAQVMALLGDLRWRAAAPLALRRLSDGSARVRGMAAQALGRMGAADALGPLLEALAENQDTDPWLRHQLIWALVGLGDVEALAALVEDPRPPVRRGAVVALRRLEAPLVARFLADGDRSVVGEAARAIYDVPIDGAMGALADLLPSISAADEHYLARRALLANRRLGGAAAAQRIGAWLMAGGHPKASREAVEILRDWEAPSSRDPMTGEWRPLEARSLAQALPAIEALAGTEVPSRLGRDGLRAWIGALDRHRESGAAQQLTDLATDHGRHWEVRRDALEAVLRNERLPREDVLAAAFADPDGRVRSLAYQRLGQRDPARAVTLLASAAGDGPAEERGAAILALGGIDHDSAREALEAMEARVVAEGTTLLELLEAQEAQGRSDFQVHDLTEAVAQLVGEEEDLGPVGDHLYALAGGDARAGRKVFLDKTETSCLRCHAYADKGGSEVGPELTDVGARLSRRDLLLSILDPNLAVAPEYENWVFALDDGTVVTGRVRSEDGDLIVVETPQKELVEFGPGEVEARRRDQSSMPQDVASHLSRRELRDLVAFLAEQE